MKEILENEFQMEKAAQLIIHENMLINDWLIKADNPFLIIFLKDSPSNHQSHQIEIVKPRKKKFFFSLIK